MHGRILAAKNHAALYRTSRRIRRGRSKSAHVLPEVSSDEQWGASRASRHWRWVRVHHFLGVHEKPIADRFSIHQQTGGDSLRTGRNKSRQAREAVGAFDFAFVRAQRDRSDYRDGPDNGHVKADPEASRTTLV